MTLAEAEKQHRMFDRSGNLIGNINVAYKCFEVYTELNQIKAKYYKAYYIAKGLTKLEGIGDTEKDEIMADLYKEVSDDDEANEFPEAKLRYGDCLYNGKGVEKNSSEALKYFERAADSGLKVAMYNTGNFYYTGIVVKKDMEKAIHYMRLSAYNNYRPAIEFCKKHDITL